MSKKLKTEILKARVPKALKDAITAFAEKHHQPEAVIVRQAIVEWLEKRDVETRVSSRSLVQMLQDARDAIRMQASATQSGKSVKRSPRPMRALRK